MNRPPSKDKIKPINVTLPKDLHDWVLEKSKEEFLFEKKIARVVKWCVYETYMAEKKRFEEDKKEED